MSSHFSDLADWSHAQGRTVHPHRDPTGGALGPLGQRSEPWYMHTEVATTRCGRHRVAKDSRVRRTDAVVRSAWQGRVLARRILCYCNPARVNQFRVSAIPGCRGQVTCIGDSPCGFLVIVYPRLAAVFPALFCNLIRSAHACASGVLGVCHSQTAGTCSFFDGLWYLVLVS